MVTSSLSIACEYLKKEPELAEILKKDRAIAYDPDSGVFVIGNLADDEKLRLEQESLLSRVKQRVREVTRSLYGSEAKTLVLSMASGYRIPCDLSVKRGYMTTTFSQRPRISERLLELLQLPEATGITCIESNKIIAVSASLAHLCDFQHELEMWGCNSADGWYAQELDRLNRHLDRLDFGQTLGTETESFEYPAIALVDVLDGMKRGLSKPDAIAEARRINIAASFSKDIFNGKPVRVVTMHGLTFN